MSTTISAAMSAGAVTAIEVLQSRAIQSPPGSDDEKIAEIAVGYGVERADAEGEAQFIIYDCWRNAKSTYYRSRQRGRAAVQAYGCLTYGRIAVTDDGADIADTISVADEVTANTSAFCDRALEVATTLGSKGPAFVRRMMAGDTVAEAAQAIGISRATAHRWRAAMATLLTPHLHLTEGAE
ncbi:Uncharacterised protein [Mycolicibacterium flavescens]|uniref:helix-turn-helix domain-containing protein n=1 Tax=Mycobacterium neumannii TaxID=2048551 RepID=UPI000F6F42DF|nr:helix-turn-helix domain-containing protein [Mycobacterium neumannii]VEG40464.1 Uncharacterised protein [Mycolicibacterium flavescens]